MTQNEIAILAKSINAQIVETHISWVLLTDNYAFKIKKPVRTSFLDFSSLRLRKFFCEEELRLNKEFTKGVYLKVIPILKHNSELKFSGNGKTIDFAVQMNKLNQNRQLSVLLSEKKIKANEIKKLAELVASIHQKTKVVHLNKVPTLAYEFEDLVLETERSTQISKSDATIIATLIFQAESFLVQYEKEFRQREKNGFVREVHGDLHSNNIFMYNSPILFDRIEFNTSFRTIDVLHELAYLCLDLEFYKRYDLSSILLKTYLKETGTRFYAVERKVFCFYKAYAANVRAKVNILQAGQKGTEGKKYMQQFKKYVELMKNYISELDS